MTRLRASLVLIGISVIAVLIGVVRLATQSTQLPTGSSYSAQPDGALAVYDWAAAVGGSPQRLRGLSVDRSISTLVIVQPENVFNPATRAAFDIVPTRGGTLVVAGDSIASVLYARSLGITVEPNANGASTASTPDNALSVQLVSAFRLRADDAMPLLVSPNGDWLALRKPYKQGSLVVFASPRPLTNAALQDDQMARFVYREVISPSIGKGLAFDEVQHSFAPIASGPPNANQLLFNTPLGQAVIYAALLTFAYLLVGSRRLGPPLPARPPAETRRTMYEHVQMLAHLYRRAHQLESVRTAFRHHYARQLGRSAGGSPTRVSVLSDALARIGSARNESDMISAVARASDPS